MQTAATVVMDVDAEQDDLRHFSRIVVKPINLIQTGLSSKFIKNLLAKHIQQSGSVSVAELSQLLKLPGSVLQPILSEMKIESQIETRPNFNGSGELIYGLTERGRLLAATALSASGYIGPAPVPLGDYEQLVKSQTVHGATFSRQQVYENFKGVSISENLLDQLGPAMHSGKAIFIYGAPGTGKTYISHRLAKLLNDPVFIPYAISIGDSVIQIFDPQVHFKHERDELNISLKFTEGYDNRYLLCERPVITTGSELLLEHIEINYDSDAKLYHAPLQLKANNGLFLIDDLGRQHIPTVDLLNRWIVPMEEKRDYHNLRSGSHFSVPFDLILLFSTNFAPSDLADDAFLRRIGHKVCFEELDEDQYRYIWIQVCQLKEFEFDPKLLNYVVQELHMKSNVPMLPCHPRDLLSLATDFARYQGSHESPNQAMMDKAWSNYFIKEKG